MQHPSRFSSPDSQLTPRLNERLHSYCVAAGAAGVGLLALTPPLSAEIVYTPANVTISTTTLHSYSLDLTADGTTDFLLSAMSRQSIDQSGGTSRIIVRAAVQSDGIVGYGGRAAALKAGQVIDGNRKLSGPLMASLHTFIGTEFSFHGPWANVKDRYLGFKFQIDGETHYGWARLSVGGTEPLAAKLTGYAYETIPDTPIVAGKTSGADDASPAAIMQPASQASSATLGALALGAAPTSPWRRRELGGTAANSL
jgi:hypothetical protein